MSKSDVARFRLQVWLAFQGSVQPDVPGKECDGFVARTVSCNQPGYPDKLLLIERDSKANALDANIDEELDDLRRVIQRMRFLSLNFVKIVSMRLVELKAGPGDKVRCRIVPLARMGAPVKAHKQPGQVHARFSLSKSTRNARPEVDRAIEWYLAAAAVDDPIAELTLLWMGLEAICPAARETWRCGSCQATCDSCPSCDKPTASLSVSRGIRNYLKDALGLGPKQVQDAYKTRSKFVHGAVSLTDESTIEAAKSADYVRGILLDSIKHELGITPTEIPLIITHPNYSVISIDSEIEVDFQVNVYDEPPCYLSAMAGTYEPPRNDVNSGFAPS